MGMTLVIAATVAVWLVVVCVAWFPRRQAGQQEQSPDQEAQAAPPGAAGNLTKAAHQEGGRAALTGAADVSGEAVRAAASVRHKEAPQHQGERP